MSLWLGQKPAASRQEEAHRRSGGGRRVMLASLRAQEPHPRPRRHRRVVRVLPAQDGGDGGDAVALDPAARAACVRAMSRSPMAPAARRASAPTPRWRACLSETTLKPAAHLTCVAATKGEVDEIIRDYWDIGVRHIVALARRSARRRRRALSSRRRAATSMPPIWSAASRTSRPSRSRSPAIRRSIQSRRASRPISTC